MDRAGHFRALGWGWLFAAVVLLILTLYAVSEGAWLAALGLLVWLVVAGLLTYGLLRALPRAWGLGVAMSVWLTVSPLVTWLTAPGRMPSLAVFLLFPLNGPLVSALGLYGLWALLTAQGRAAWRTYERTSAVRGSPQP